MSIIIPGCNAHAYMKFSKKNFASYAKNATVKNIITINKYNVGMKSLDRAIIVSAIFEIFVLYFCHICPSLISHLFFIFVIFVLHSCHIQQLLNEAE